MSRKYKFIYLHVLKSGGMSLKTFLKMGMCGTVDVVRKKGCGPNNDYELMEIVDCKSAVTQHPGYLVWSFVRNPFGRMYSAYSMAKHGHKKPGSTDHITFDMFANNPSAFSGFSTTSPAHWVNQINYIFSPSNKGTCTVLVVNPAACVCFLDGTMIDAAATGSSHALPENSHAGISPFHQFFDFVASHTEGPAVDFLGRIEYLHEDMAELLKVIKSPELDKYFKEVGIGKAHETSFGARLAGNSTLQKRYSGEGVREDVAKHFRKDFKTLGYDPSFVPLK
jgi:hypothetical protein